jgi:hypothetical protein
MNNQRILGLVLLVAGVILSVIGMNATRSLADRFSNFFSGHFTDGTVWYLVAGGISALAGLLMLFAGGRAATA